MSQREYRQTLESRAASLEAELASLRQEIAETVRALESRGVSRVDWGDLRRVQPLSPNWGRDRGQPIDRHYIEGFSRSTAPTFEAACSKSATRLHAAVRRRRGHDLRRHRYRFGERPRHVIADLRRADAIPSATYDCIILTQTLQLIDDIAAVLAECARILRPGGVLLVTVPSVIRVDDEAGRDGDFWRLTEASARKLFAEVFPVDAFEVTTYGNVMACTAFLYGMSVEEMAPADLDRVDPNVSRRHRRSRGEAERCRDADAASRGFRPDRPRPEHHRRPSSPTIESPSSRPTPTSCARRPTSSASTWSTSAATTRRSASRISSMRAAARPDPGTRRRGHARRRVPGRADVASPILAELGVPATFFVNSDRLDEEHERWWDMLERDFPRRAGRCPPDLEITIGGRDWRMPTEQPRGSVSTRSIG